MRNLSRDAASVVILKKVFSFSQIEVKMQTRSNFLLQTMNKASVTWSNHE